MKTLDLTPGDSRDYNGVRVKVVNVGTTKKGTGPRQPCVTVELSEVSGGGNGTKKKAAKKNTNDAGDDSQGAAAAENTKSAKKSAKKKAD